MPLIPILRRQREVDFYEFKISLDNRESSRTARIVTQRNTFSKKKKLDSFYMKKISTMF